MIILYEFLFYIIYTALRYRVKFLLVIFRETKRYSNENKTSNKRDYAKRDRCTLERQDWNFCHASLQSSFTSSIACDFFFSKNRSRKGKEGIRKVGGKTFEIFVKFLKIDPASFSDFFTPRSNSSRDKITAFRKRHNRAVDK